VNWAHITKHMKHDKEMCLCEKCIRELLKAHDEYLKAWLRENAKWPMCG